MNYAIHVNAAVPFCVKKRRSRVPTIKCIVVMKLFLLLFAVSLEVSASVHSQQITLSVKNAPLVEVMQSIRKQSGLAFMAAAEAIDKAKPVTVVLKDATIEESLAAIFRDQPFDYKVENKFIILTAKVAISTSLILPQPEGDVHGVVVDSAGIPVANATVLVKGEKNKITITNDKGEFNISDVPSKGIILVRSIGFGTIERAYNPNSASINIQLKPVNTEIKEIQIIAYGQINKKFSTSNVTMITAGDIAKQPVSNPLLALQGRVPGLFITQSSGVTAAPVNVNLQGINSLQNGTAPFYVIDGIPYSPQFTDYSLLGTAINGPSGSTFNFINPADIESISILKDADATAIYGSRAANGAILITTKKGKAGKTKVDVNFQNGWGKINHKLKFLNTQQYLEMRKEAYKNAGQEVPNSSTSPDASNFDLTLWDQNKYTDWQKVLVGGTAKFTDIQASISGGTATTQFLAGYGYNRQTTVYPNSLADVKGSVHLNLNHNSFNNRFKYTISATYLQDKNQLNGTDLMDLATQLPPNAPALYNSDGSLNFEPYSSNPIRYSFSNPLVNTKVRYTGNTANLTVNNSIGYEIVPNLQLKVNMGYSKLSADETNIIPITVFRPDAEVKTRSASYLTKSIISWIIEPQITYSKETKFGIIDALLGSTFQQSKNDVLQLTGSGYANDAQLENILAASTVNVNNVYKSIYRYNAIFGRINYRIQDKYIINLIARRDGSSRFGDENKLNTFYSLGGAWLFAEENLIKQNISWLSSGKIRANYGTTGNDQIPDYTYQSLFDAYRVDLPYQQSVGLYTTTISNPLLQWEETRKLNLGIELGFLNDRIQVDANYSRNRSSNQLIGYILPTITGFNFITKNFPATIQNTALELMINVNPIKTKKFNWQSSVNFTAPKNKLIAFAGLEDGPYASSYILGQPINIRKLFRFAGVNPTTGLYEFLNSKGEKTSSLDYEKDRTVIFNPNPKWYGGFSNSFQYQGFQLDFLIQFVNQKGQDNRFGNVPGISPLNQPSSILHRWKNKGDVTTIQKVSTSFDILDPSFFANSSDAAYTSASFVRLKNASFSYTLPSRLMNRLRVSNARIYMQGQNLLTVTNFVGSDPETRGLGVLPPLRMFTLGIQVTL